MLKALARFLIPAVALLPILSASAGAGLPATPDHTQLATDALLVLVDRSASMVDNSKWATVSQGIVQALDQDPFDALDLGLIASPTGAVTGPACIFGFPVACQAPAAPQENLGPAGPKSSVGPGKRRSISDWLSANGPITGYPDASPLYAATQAALGALQAWGGTGHRILVVITDGSISCGQLAARPGFGDCNGCDHEWEDPQNIVSLVTTAKGDATRPVDTFVIGVPGADSYDASGCNYPPYHMRLALSAIAAAGSPEHVPADCDGRTFSQGGGDPATDCHFDVTQALNASTVEDAITAARSRVLDSQVDVSHDPSDPQAVYLAPPRPNPARGWSLFRFGLTRPGPVSLGIYDLGGRLVRELVGGPLEAGHRTIGWDLRDGAGAPVAGGLYFLRLRAEGVTRMERLSVVR
jgi:hypothetical protein